MPAKKSAKRASNSGLNPKQRAFAREYLKDFNATQAARRAGYSERTAYSQGQRLLKHAEVQAAVARGAQRAADTAEVTVDSIVEGLREISECDVTAVARWNERGEVILTRFEDVPPEIRRCISEIRQGEDKFGRPFPIVKFHSKTEAKKLLGQYRGMFTQKVELEAGDTLMRGLSKVHEALAAKRAREKKGE